LPRVDQQLLSRTIDLSAQFDHAIANLANATLDLRIFFTVAHKYITSKIARHVELFFNPNELMRLNDCFATTYLAAIKGHPHHDWERAFSICRAESDAVSSGFVGLAFLGPIAAETCAACMANVHINRDLRDALIKIRNVDAQDYGNILIFVEEGNLYAETMLRGRGLGAAAFEIGLLFASMLSLDIKKWRNDVFQRCCNQPVPDPSAEFILAYRKAEGR
jgi:hypothetical protein